jgi:energy-coupling factor transporter ATP-binding protein EcfA2
MTEAPQEIRLIEQRESQKDYPPAYFLSLELENVLCFKTPQTLDMSDKNGRPAQWTVILGDNGVGKTTLLRCLAEMEPRPLPSSKEVVSNSIPRLFFTEENNVRERALRAYSANFIVKFAYGSVLNNEEHNGEQSSGVSALTNLATNQDLLAKEPQQLTPVFQDGYFRIVGPTCEAYGGEKLLGLKCYAYGANRRMGKTSLSEALSADSCASLFSDSEVLINSEEWLLRADYAVARSAPNNTARLEERFYLIQDTLRHLLPDVSDIRIALADDGNPRPVAEFQTPYGWVPLKRLSLGYKTVIAWTVDLAARLIDRYPHSKDPLSEPAVVLVDEIDLHLHPKWQRTIMSFLTQRFPNTQFIVTAHSPLVVQAAGNANIVLLRREDDHVVIDNDPEIIDNWRVEQILASVFELPSPHSPAIEPLIERRRKLLAKPKLTAKDQQELEKLEVQIGTLPTAESPEDIRAMDIIRKAAKLLENS